MVTPCPVNNNFEEPAGHHEKNLIGDLLSDEDEDISQNQNVKERVHQNNIKQQQDGGLTMLRYQDFQNDS